MTHEYVIRCTPADPEMASGIVRDGSGEVCYFPTTGAALSEACDRQERATRNHARVEYSVEAA
jgi:hypothetical protein